MGWFSGAEGLDDALGMGIYGIHGVWSARKGHPWGSSVHDATGYCGTREVGHHGGDG